jgi:hypothetical protein
VPEGGLALKRQAGAAMTGISGRLRGVWLGNAALSNPIAFKGGPHVQYQQVPGRPMLFHGKKESDERYRKMRFLLRQLGRPSSLFERSGQRERTSIKVLYRFLTIP